jgi:hypothetical protein
MGVVPVKMVPLNPLLSALTLVEAKMQAYKRECRRCWDDGLPTGLG